MSKMSGQKEKKMGACGMEMKMAKKKQPRGSGLIAVILVLAFMLTVGVAVLTVTSSGPKVSASMRYQEEAFNAAEAGFDAARMTIEDYIGNQWVNFGNHYLNEPDGIDIPFLNGNLNSPNPLYFRRLTDEQILNLLDSDHDGTPNIGLGKLVFFEEPFVFNNGRLDERYRYTVFLIDDEAGTGLATDPTDVLMVCIGVVRSGSRVTDRILATCRLEIEVEMPQAGTSP